MNWLKNPYFLPMTGNVILQKVSFLSHVAFSATIDEFKQDIILERWVRFFPETLGTIILRTALHLWGISVNALFWFQWVVTIIESVCV